ncbi:Uncharacterised protein [uncultured Eubacterium sp.]|nr:Uncharacterised protein [uncultured Eubacterium sp.]
MDDLKKMIEIKHHKDDYECMWNGIEDLYMDKTGEILPDNLFFLLSRFGSFCYMKTEKSELKRMVALGDGRTKKMYEFLAPIVGFDYRHYSYGTFDKALRKAKLEIDGNYPVVLGALDMYHLPYLEKLYHREHIPFHYILMVGYDEEQGCIYLHDCGRRELQTLSYDELSKAMNCSYPGLSKANTICTIRMNTEKDKYQITQEALTLKRESFLNPPRSFLGYQGFEKFIAELPTLRLTLGKEDYDKILLNMVTFFGTVPTLPNALKGIDEPDEVVFKGSFDKMSKMLRCMGEEYGNPQWLEAAKYFFHASIVVEKISLIIITYLADEKGETNQLADLFSSVLSLMKQAYQVLGV